MKTHDPHLLSEPDSALTNLNVAAGEYEVFRVEFFRQDEFAVTEHFNRPQNFFLRVYTSETLLL